VFIGDGFSSCVSAPAPLCFFAPPGGAVEQSENVFVKFQIKSKKL